MKKIWRLLFVGMVIILLIETIIIVGLVSKTNTVSVCETSLEDAIDSNYGGYVPESGYISDAETAAIVGNAIINNLCRTDNREILAWEEGYNDVVVDYDSSLRLWRISKGYMHHRGAVVIIEQDSGKVITAYFQK